MPAFVKNPKFIIGTHRGPVGGLRHLRKLSDRDGDVLPAAVQHPETTAPTLGGDNRRGDFRRRRSDREFIGYGSGASNSASSSVTRPFRRSRPEAIP